MMVAISDKNSKGRWINMKALLEKALSHCSAGISWLIYGIFYLLMVAIIFAPAYMIDLPGILSHILVLASFLVMIFLPLLWPIVQLILWIISIPYALHYRLCAYLVYYLISLAVYVFLDLIPMIYRFITLSRKK